MEVGTWKYTHLLLLSRDCFKAIVGSSTSDDLILFSYVSYLKPAIFISYITCKSMFMSLGLLLPHIDLLNGHGSQPMIPVAYCDAGAALSGDYISSIQRASADIFQKGSLKYTTKEYYIELKPLFSAFEWKQLAMTSLRSFLMFYLPLLEPSTNTEEDDDDFLQDAHEVQRVDLVVPFQKSVKQIIREVSCILLLVFPLYLL